MSGTMTGEDLKNSILQMAMQGKLVEQRPEEGTGEELYQQIQKEKQKLIKEGKIKKEKKLDPITEDEIPFEIPESWKWVRIVDVCTKLVDGDHNPPKGKGSKTDYLMASSRNINNDTLVDLDQVRYLDAETFAKEDERTSALKGDIFFTSVGSLGRSCVYDGGMHICFQRSVSVVTTLLYNQFLKRFFDTGYFQNKVYREATGTAQKGFYLNQLAQAIVPVPPLAEQKRIVAKIEELMPFVEQYSSASTKLNTLNTSFPDQLKKSILQRAVEGKLIPQDPNDEPASVLLEKIRKEKDKLIKEGKIKKQKKLPPINEEEKPFDIPDSWEWVRLGEFVELITSGSRGWAKYYSNEGAVFLRMGNLSRGSLSLRLDKVQRVNIPEGAEGTRTSLQEGDLLFSITGDVGNTGLIPPDFGEAYVNQHTAVIRFLEIERNKFFPYILLSEFCKEQYDSKKHGIKNSFRLDSLAYTVVPLPPLDEQQRIVTAIEESWDLINNPLREKM